MALLRARYPRIVLRRLDGRWGRRQRSGSKHSDIAFDAQSSDLADELKDHRMGDRAQLAVSGNVSPPAVPWPTISRTDDWHDGRPR